MKGVEILEIGDTNEIYKFKRKSDGEIFKIGDIVSIENNWTSNDCKIHAIEFKDNKNIITIKQEKMTGKYVDCLERWVNISNKNKKLYKIY